MPYTPWIEFSVALRDHWKINRLASRLGIPYPYALGLMACLWTWAVDNTKKGDLKPFSDDEIIRASKLEKPFEGFKNLLIECELIDKHGRINDWDKHGIRLLESSRNRQKKHRDSLRDNNVMVTPMLRPSNLSNHTNLSIKEKTAFKNEKPEQPVDNSLKAKYELFLSAVPYLRAIPKRVRADLAKVLALLPIDVLREEIEVLKANRPLKDTIDYWIGGLNAAMNVNEGKIFKKGPENIGGILSRLTTKGLDG